MINGENDVYADDLNLAGRKRYEADYAEYLKRIEQYKGTAYYQQLLNNPYYQYEEYSPGALESLWYNISGSRRHMDDFYNSRKTSGDEYMSDIINAMHQESYSDPAAEVARRKAAGLNDDLNGGSQIGSGTAPDVSPDDTPPINGSGAPEDSGVLAQVAELGFSAFTRGLSLISFFQDVAGKSIANGAADISLTDQAYDFAIKQLAGSSSLPGTREEYDALSESDKKGIDDMLFAQLEASVANGQYKGMFATRRAKQLVKLMRGTAQYDKDGKPTLAYEAYRSKLLAERYGSHKQTAEVLGTPGFSENLIQFGTNLAECQNAIVLATQRAQQRIAEAQAKIAEANAGVADPMAAAGLDSAQAKARSDQAMADYNQSAYTSERGASDAATGIALNDAAQSQAANRQIMEDLRHDVNAAFAELSKKGKELGGFQGMIIQLLVPFLQAQTMSAIENGLGATALNRSGAGAILPALL